MGLADILAGGVSPTKCAAAKAAATPTAGFSLGSEPVLLDSVVATVMDSRRGASGGFPRHVRASASARWCPRAEVLAHHAGRAPEAVHLAVGSGGLLAAPPLHLAQTLELGTAAHKHYQNDVMGPAGVLWGHWSCVSCGASWGSSKPEDWVQHPAYTKSACCKHPHVVLVEAEIENDALGLSGHLDGGTKLRNGTMVGTEIKTISDTQFGKLKKPLASQKWQATVYCMIFGLPAVVFFYISKGWHPERPQKAGGDAWPRRRISENGWQHCGYKEFVFARDPNIERALTLGRSQVTRALSGGPLPPRLSACASPTSSRCKSCRLAKACWEA